MKSIYTNARCKAILDLLLSDDNYIPVQQILEATKVSKRSFYYDLCKINEWLACYDIPELEVMRGKGLLIPKEDKQLIRKNLELKTIDEQYIFSPSERVQLIICYIFLNETPVNIEHLSMFCQVSRNTIFNDLRIVVRKLQDFRLTLAYESKSGYYIEGDVLKARTLFLQTFNQLLPLYDRGALSFIPKHQTNTYLETLTAMEHQLNTQYVYGVLTSLSVLMPVMLRSVDKPYFIDLNKKEIEQTAEYQLAVEYFPDLPNSEQRYLALHLLGSRVGIVSDKIFENSSNQSVYEITKALVSEFEKLACIVFEDKEELERGLFLHINASLYRYQYGIQIGDSMYEDIIREYPQLYNITKQVSKQLEQMIGLSISDSETAYFALHFGAHLKIADNHNKLKILIVCGSGISSGYMLKREIQKLLPDCIITDVIAAQYLPEKEKNCDLIISTVKINTELPLLVVHPILSNYDRRLIINHPLLSKTQSWQQGESLFQLVKKYVSEDSLDDLRSDLIQYFQSGQELDALLQYNANGLLYYLRQSDRISFVDTKMHWEDAIRYAATTLLNAHSIDPRYVDAIIEKTHEFGPYMMIIPGLVLAHAKPEDGVHTVDVSMTVFSEPVVFSDTESASIIFTLSTVDHEKHLTILKDIMDIFSEMEESELNFIGSLDVAEVVLKFLESKI